MTKKEKAQIIVTALYDLSYLVEMDHGLVTKKSRMPMVDLNLEFDLAINALKSTGKLFLADPLEDWKPNRRTK